MIFSQKSNVQLFMIESFDVSSGNGDLGATVQNGMGWSRFRWGGRSKLDSPPNFLHIRATGWGRCLYLSPTYWRGTIPTLSRTENQFDASSCLLHIRAIERFFWYLYSSIRIDAIPISGKRRADLESCCVDLFVFGRQGQWGICPYHFYILGLYLIIVFRWAAGKERCFLPTFHRKSIHECHIAAKALFLWVFRRPELNMQYRWAQS